MKFVLFVNAPVGFSENLFLVIVAFFKNATIEYSSGSVCVFLQDNSKSNRSRNMKFEYIVVYESISDKIDNGHCQIKVKVTVGL